MTTDHDFKQVVRRRMAETGEPYSAARAALLDHDAQARSAQERLVTRLFTDGRIAQVPAKRLTRAAVLLEVLSRFEPGRDYAERQVNEILLGVHEDFAYLRRELVNYGYLTRESGTYRVTAQVPDRPDHMRQEIPAWEAVWLPGFIRRGRQQPQV